MTFLMLELPHEESPLFPHAGKNRNLSWVHLFACFDTFVETDQPTNPDTEFKIVCGRTIKIPISS